MSLSNFIQRLEPTLEDIQQDLYGLSLNISDCKIGDFGCEFGYETLPLMLHLHAIECTGADKEDVWQLPTIEKARHYFSTAPGVPTSDLSGEVRERLDSGYWPTFQQDDVLHPQNLPNNLDLAYCRLLLGNIHNGEYINSPKGVDGAKLAISNIVACIRQGGLFYIVEKPTIDFRPFLSAANLKFLRCRGRHWERCLEDTCGL